MIQEAVAGRSRAEVKRIVDIIRDYALKCVSRAGPREPSIPKFEAGVNALLADTGIRFEQDNAIFKKHNAPAYAGPDGVVLNTRQMTPHAIVMDARGNRLPGLIGHELVHADQIAAAGRKGGADKMFDASMKRMFKGGQFQRDAYATDKHEIMAYAHTLVADMLDNGESPKEVMKVLRRGSRTGLDQWPKHKKRFIKNALGYLNKYTAEKPA